MSEVFRGGHWRADFDGRISSYELFARLRVCGRRGAGEELGRRAARCAAYLFIGYFAEHAEEFGVRVYPSLRTRVSDSRIRVPDVLLQRRDDPFEDIVTVPPLLCIEVLSPEDRMIAMLEKIDDYLEMGVPVVWLIDPRRRRMFCGDKEGLHPVAELVVPGSDVRLASAEVFADFNAWVTGSRRSSAE